MKLRTRATLEIPSDEICRLLTEAICDTGFNNLFQHMEVCRITRTDHGKFRVDMWLKAEMQAKPKPVAVAERKTG